MKKRSDQYDGFVTGASVWVGSEDWDQPLPATVKSVSLRTAGKSSVADSYTLLDEDGDRLGTYDAYYVRETKREILILMMKMQQETIHEIETQLQDATDRLWKLNMTYDECLD